MQMSQLPAPGDQPPVYQWLPDSTVNTSGDGASWLPPAPPARPASPQQHSPTAPRQQSRRREGAAGGIIAGLIAFFKYGLFLVKFGTFGPTLITMVIAIWFYTLFFGPAFGTVAALVCFLLAGAANPGYFRYLLLALAYFGCFLNLINLIPVGFLDGAKVADAIPKWMNVLGLLVVAGVVLFLGTPIGLIFLILGIFHTISRFRRSNQMTAQAQTAASRRVGLGAAYVGILLVAAAGMSIANTTIVNSNSVP